MNTAPAPDPAPNPFYGPKPEGLPPLEAELKSDEGYSLHPYQDSKGRWCIGVGCDMAAHAFLDKHGGPLLSEVGPQWIEDQLQRDITTAAANLDRYFPWWRCWTGVSGAVTALSVRQRVLLNMMFNLGPGNAKHGFLSFVNTLASIQEGAMQERSGYRITSESYFVLASHQMANSKWAKKDVPQRAARLIRRMATGRY